MTYNAVTRSECQLTLNTPVPRGGGNQFRTRAANDIRALYGPWWHLDATSIEARKNHLHIDAAIRNTYRGGRKLYNMLPRCTARFRGAYGGDRFFSQIRVGLTINESDSRNGPDGIGFTNALLDNNPKTREVHPTAQRYIFNWKNVHYTEWLRMPRDPFLGPHNPRRVRRWPPTSFFFNANIGRPNGNYGWGPDINSGLRNSISFVGTRRVQVKLPIGGDDQLQPLRHLSLRFGGRDVHSNRYFQGFKVNGVRHGSTYVYDDDAQIATGQGAWHVVDHPLLPGNRFHPKVPSKVGSKDYFRGFSRISHEGFDSPQFVTNALEAASSKTSGPTHTWLTYLLAPKNGHYAFSYLDAGNTRNINDEFQFYKISTAAEEAGEKASLIESFPVQLKKDEIVLAYGRYKKSIQPLSWQISKRSKANGNEMNNFREVPASAMFLSADAAILSKGINEINDEGSDNAATFQIFSTRKPTGNSFKPQLSEILNIEQTSNTQSAFNSDELTAFAHDGSGSTHLFHDYRINQKEHIKFEPMQLEPKGIKLPIKLYAANFEVKTLQDPYAEKNPSDSSATYESIRMSLKTGFFQRHNMLHSMPGNHDWNIPIIDSAPIVSLSHSG